MSLCFGCSLPEFNSYLYHLVAVSLRVRWLTSIDFNILLKSVGLPVVQWLRLHTSGFKPWSGS